MSKSRTAEQSVGSETYGFDAIRGIQAKREFYVAMCPLKIIPKLFIFNEEEVSPQFRAQRILRDSRIPSIANYIVNNPKDYVFSSLTASVDGAMRFVPDPSVGSDGKTKEVMNTEPLSDKWKSFGWNVIELKDGHNLDLVFEALDAAINGMNPGPSVVLANTIAGKGVSFMEGTWQWHLGFLGKEDLEKAYEEIERGLE